VGGRFVTIWDPREKPTEGVQMALPATGRRRATVAALAAAALVVWAGVSTGQAGPTGTAGSPPLPRPPWSANLLPGERGSFDHSIGKWTSSRGARATLSLLVHQQGKGSLELTNISSKTRTMYAQSGHTASTYTTAAAGERYAFSFWARGVDDRDVAGELIFLNANGHQLAGVYGMRRKQSTHAWVHVTNTVAIAPPTTRYVTARALVYGAVPSETEFFDTAVLQRARGGSPTVAGPLHTSGNRIVDANGRPIQLRGVVRMGLQGAAPVSPPTAHDIGQAKSWGANVIRLALGEQLWPGLPQDSCHQDPSYPSKVDNAVQLITGMGMYVVLEMHWNTIQQCGSAKPYPMADCNVGACNADAFWTAIANRYQQNPRVGFELYNEPHDISESVWRYGGAITYKGVHYTTAGMQPMYNAIRATGATNLVFVTGLNWGNKFPPGGPLSGSNIVYSAHSYTCPNSPPPRCTSLTPYDGSTYLHTWVGPGERYPVVVEEFGWPDPSSSWYAQSLISYAEAHHWGWIEFTWGDNTHSRFALMKPNGAFGTYEPRPGGMPALQTFPGA
jgi:hypothetical protein